MDFDNQSMTLEEAITIIREIDPSAEETNSRRAETLILQAVHDGANVEFPSDNISFSIFAVDVKKRINAIPAADVAPVVRCKDCKWCHAGYCEKYDDLIPFGCANKPWEDWFCADGAKMDKEDANG